jgi:acyl-coenzyme A synthetase/AMP-(fatty) acid ligase
VTAPDFWDTQASGSPSRLGYASPYERFVWALTSAYNLGVDACDRHAAGKGKPARIHGRGDGTAEKRTFRELKRASDRVANALQDAVGKPDPAGCQVVKAFVVLRRREEVKT